MAASYPFAENSKLSKISLGININQVLFKSQVVITDNNPVALHYVPHLDQVWVLNWRSTRDQGVKTIQVIRDASQKRKHHTVHPEPIDGHFDLVKDLFMPPIQVSWCCLNSSDYFKYSDLFDLTFSIGHEY